MVTGSDLTWSAEDYRRRRAYCAAVAVSVGVDAADVDDVIHDILEQSWRSGVFTNWSVRFDAIDAVRRYKGRRQRRVAPVYLDDVKRDPESPRADVETLLDFRAAWRRLAPGMRATLAAVALGLSDGDNDPRRHWRVYYARRALRRQMAG